MRGKWVQPRPWEGSEQHTRGHRNGRDPQSALILLKLTGLYTADPSPSSHSSLLHCSSAKYRIHSAFREGERQTYSTVQCFRSVDQTVLLIPENVSAIARYQVALSCCTLQCGKSPNLTDAS